MQQMKQTVMSSLILLSIALSASAEIAVRSEDAPAAKPSPSPATVAVTPVVTAPPAEGADTLEFINSDKLHGNLLAVSSAGVKPTGALSWKHPATDKVIEFGIQGLARATLAPRKLSQAAAPSATIYLTNGDMLPGNVISMDNEKLIIDTWYAGRVTVNRLMLKSMNPNSGVSTTIYEGPTGLAEWTTYRNAGAATQWKFKNGALYAVQSYPIGKEVEGLPDAADIRFDAAWRNSYPQFYFMFCTDNAQDTGSGYMLQISGNSISLQRFSRETGSRNLGGNVNYEAFSEGKLRSARFNILCDKSKKVFALLINGTLVTQWSDAASFSGKGNCISFRSNNNGDLKISNIRIAQWDGKIPEAAGVTSDTVVKEDMVRFVNNDKVSGQIKAISGGNLKLETSYATLDIPLTRVADIVASTEKAERARKNKEDIRASFADKGILTLQLNRIEKDEVKGKSENFGEITLPLGALRQVEFNIYQERQVETDEDAF